MAGGDIRAGGAFVEMFVKDGTVQKTLASVRRQLTTFGQSIRSIGLGAIGLGGAVGAPMIAAVASFAESGAAIDDMANKTGIGADALQELSYAAGQSATDINSLEKGLIKMQRNMVEAGKGSLTASAAFNSIGLSVADLSAMTGDAQFEAIATQIASIQDPAHRTAAAIGIFGKSGADLLPLLNEGASGIAKMREEAKRLGLVMDQDAIKNAAILDDGIHRITMSFGAFKNAVGAAISGPAIQFAEWLTQGAVSTAGFVNENRGLVIGIGAVAGSLVIAGGALVGLGLTLSLMGTAVGGLATAWGALGSVLAAVAGSPIALTLAGIAAIVAVVPSLREGVMSAIGDLMVGFGDLLGTVTTTLDGIADAMAAGNMQAAANVLWAGVNLAWLQGTAGLRSVWREAVSGLAMMSTDAFSGLRSAWALTVQFMGDAWDIVTGGMGGAWSSLQNTISQGILNAVAKFGGGTDADIIQREKDLKESLAEEANAQKQASQNRMTQRQAETKAKLDAISKEGNAATDVIAENLVAQQAAAQQELTDAQAALQVAREEAASARRDVEAKKTKRTTAAASAFGNEFTSTVGSFSAASAVQSRVGGLSGLQSASERTADATEELAERAKNGGVVFA